jgi:hypothetical protein
MAASEKTVAQDLANQATAYASAAHADSYNGRGPDITGQKLMMSMAFSLASIAKSLAENSK